MKKSEHMGDFRVKRGSAYKDRKKLNLIVRGVMRGMKARGSVLSNLAVRGIIQTTMRNRSWVPKTRIFG